MEELRKFLLQKKKNISATTMEKKYNIYHSKIE